MAKLRVVQWTTGKVGKLATRAILDDPRLKLVGMFAHSADKVGKDAGELCGRPETITGVKATSDIDALLALKADTVMYTPFEADLDTVVSLLENGLDVVSTNMFLNLGGIEGKVKKKLEKACKKGNSSLYITGINPGWINSVVASLTAGCRRHGMCLDGRIGGLFGLRIGRDLELPRHGRAGRHDARTQGTCPQLADPVPRRGAPDGRCAGVHFRRYRIFL